MKTNSFLYLVFRIIEMLASISALVSYSFGFLFYSLYLQIILNVSGTSHTIGSSVFVLRHPKSRSTACSGVRAGQYTRRQLSSQSLPSAFWLQESSAWDRLSGTPSVHRAHRGEGTEPMCILWSLSWVGRISWRTFHRKDWFSESRPLSEDSLKILHQWTCGLFHSFLEGIYLRIQSVQISIVTFLSTKDLYNCPEDKVDKSLWPSSCICFKKWKYSSVK